MTCRLKMGLIVRPEFVILEQSCAAVTLPLIRALVRRFETRLIYDQATFDTRSREVDFLLSLEADWASPRIHWRKVGTHHWNRSRPCYLCASDPHLENGRQEYIQNEEIDFVLAYYWHPTLRSFTTIPESRLIHFPWAIPDNFVPRLPISFRRQRKVMIFGAGQGDAYDLRNWCRRQSHVESYEYSGNENKVMDDDEYFEWLGTFDAVVAAGSENPTYQLTTPKYFEALAAGCLLFGQETPDCPLLGFIHGENCMLFDKANFNASVAAYIAAAEDPSWLCVREAGQQLIRERHTVSRRIATLEAHIRRQIAEKAAA
jgi:hypothetical protein